MRISTFTSFREAVEPSAPSEPPTSSPELWDPVTGRTRDTVYFGATVDGRTTVLIHLPENGSVFVVFRRPIEAEHRVLVSARGDAWEIAGRNRHGVQLELWEEGRYEFTTAVGEQTALELTKLPEPKSLTGPWTVDFTPGWGAPDSIALEKLIPWNETSARGNPLFLRHGQLSHDVRVGRGAGKLTRPTAFGAGRPRRRGTRQRPPAGSRVDGPLDGRTSPAL